MEQGGSVVPTGGFSNHVLACVDGRYAMKAMRKVNLIKNYGEEVWASCNGEPIAVGKYLGGTLQPTRVFVVDSQ